MAFKVGQESIAGGYIGSSSASAIYIGAVLAWSAATPTPPTPPVTDKTLVITYVSESQGIGMDRGCSMANIFDFTSTWNDAEFQADNSLNVYSPFSGDYENSTITIVGPFSGSSYVVHCSGMESVCQQIDNDITFQFSADTAEIMSDYTPPEPDPECECIQGGGTWDGEECHYEEPPVDPCIEDPCSCDPNPDECYCIQNGGTWDGSECIYDEPLSATTIALSVDTEVASAITINFYKMLNSDPGMGGDWTEDELLGTFDFELPVGYAETIWDLVSSSITSAITSAELLGDWQQGEEYKLSVVSPLLDGNCEPDTAYAFRAVAHTYGGGMIKAKCINNDSGDENICSNAELSIDYDAASVIRTLTITDLPDFDNMSDMYDNWTIEITDNDKFSFNRNKYYNMAENEWIEDVTFENNGNQNVTYTLLGTTLIVNGDWDAYDGEGQGEYTLNMKFSTNNCTYDDETYVAGEAQLQFTGYTDTIQFDDGNPICETYLIMNISSIPSDGSVHEYKVTNSDSETISILKIDTSDWTYETTDDPDGQGYGFYTDEFDDQGDLSQGWARWKVKGPFIGTYYIYVDNVPLQSEPDYDGSEMVAYVDVSTDAMDTFSCYGEWDCVENNPGCTWDPNTGTCDCGGV